jgi:hypothetical protein
MSSMSDVAMSNQLLGPHLCHATPLFGLLLAKSSAPCCHQIEGKTDAAWRQFFFHLIIFKIEL